MCDQEAYYNDLIKEYGYDKASKIMSKIYYKSSHSVLCTTKPADIYNKTYKNTISIERQIFNSQCAKAEYGYSLND